MALSSETFQPSHVHLRTFLLSVNRRCVPQGLTWARSPRPDIVRPSSHQSYSRMKGLVWWRPRLSGPGAIPPAAGDRRGETRRRSSGLPLPFDRIIGRCTESTQRAGKSLEPQETCNGGWRAICTRVQVNLLKDRNRGRRSTDWFS